jgi:hypothetical protein
VGVRHIKRSVKDPELTEKLIPNFKMGCKRILLSNKWYRALPQLFLTFGPNLYTFSSAFLIIEAQLKYITSAIKQARSKNISTLEVNPKKSQDFNIKVQSSLQKTVWNSGCTSYFLDKSGQNSTNWPWTTFYMRKKLARFKLTDHIVVKN